MRFEKSSPQAGNVDLGKRMTPEQLQALQEQLGIQRPVQPSRPERSEPAAPKQRSLQEEFRGKIAAYGEMNSAYEDLVTKQTERLNPLNRTMFDGNKQQSTESVQQSIESLNDSIETNKIKQIYLNFAKTENPDELRAQLTKDQGLAAKEVEKAYLESIQSERSADSLKKLKARQTRLRAVSELWDEFNRTSN